MDIIKIQKPIILKPIIFKSALGIHLSIIYCIIRVGISAINFTINDKIHENNECHQKFGICCKSIFLTNRS